MSRPTFQYTTLPMCLSIGTYPVLYPYHSGLLGSADRVLGAESIGVYPRCCIGTTVPSVNRCLPYVLRAYNSVAR